MAQRGFRVALVGATGAVGAEVRSILQERRFPVLELVPFATPDSEGDEIEFRGEEIKLQRVSLARLLSTELILNAASGALDAHWDELRASDVPLVDVTGALELDPAIPMWMPGLTVDQARAVAVPRGVMASLGLALAPLARVVELTRVTAVSLESAGGVGRGGIDELANHTIELLNGMTGEVSESAVFPTSLAFECVPAVGDLMEDGDTTEERRLQHGVRRLLGTPSLPVEVSRIRVPTFGGSLVSVHMTTSHQLLPSRARELWSAQPGIDVLGADELPTPRGALGRDEITIGRVRAGREDAPGLAFAVASDDLRRGSALGAVEAAEALLSS